MKKIAIFISGAGSNMLALAQQIQTGTVEAKIAYIISDKPEATGIKKAQQLGLKTQIISWQKENIISLIKQLQKDDIDYIILAGFMRLLPPDFVNVFSQKIINIHPSLLPKYKGLKAIKRSFESVDKYGGITIHYVDEGMDTGPIIAQFKVPRLPNDTLADFEARIHKCEHENYGKILQQIFTGVK